MRALLLAAAAACLAACSNAAVTQTASAETPVRAAPAENEAVAVFAGGCFWCIEAELEEVPGVRTVISGYTGGTTPNPTYQRMGDHAEAVEVIYDPEVVTYEQLLEVFWSNIDPTDEGGQFYDRDDAQAAAARASLEANAKRLNQPIATAVLPASEFYPAEEYHQDYYLKEPDRYEAYKKGSRREETLKEVWGTQ
jgi:methionine-S-sulfoxide reductase